jgi:hypothetical protein
MNKGDSSALILAGRRGSSTTVRRSWARLRAKSHEGSGQLSTVAFIRRAKTKGGTAPAAGCDASHISEQARMRHSAEYQFFSIAK